MLGIGLAPRTPPPGTAPQAQELEETELEIAAPHRADHKVAVRSAPAGQVTDRRGQAALAGRLALAVAALVAAAGAVVGGEGSDPMSDSRIRETGYLRRNSRRTHSETTFFALAISVVLLFPAVAHRAQEASQTGQPTAQAHQEKFATAQDAANALITAVDKYDVGSLTQILGPEGNKLFSSKDPVRDKNLAENFASMARERHSVAIDPQNPQRGYLVVGNSDWPWPVPLVERDGKWLFDTSAGIREVLYRRIGSNELDALEVCRGYVDAQHAYALTKHDGAEVNQYAQRIISTPGKHDGLVWQNPDGTLGGALPISKSIADALQEGYSERGQPYHGYYFKILKGQGPDAPLGELNFVVRGAMIGGFALAAAPAEYRVTGVKTFIVSYQGVVYQKDLGPHTLTVFRELTLYNPDKSWQPTDDNWWFDTPEPPAAEATSSSDPRK